MEDRCRDIRLANFYKAAYGQSVTIDYLCNDPAGQCWNQYSGWLHYNLRHQTVSVAKFCLVRGFLVGQGYCELYTVLL